jgi:segregation and condensation protein B
MLMNESYVRNVIEAALLAAGKSLQPADLAALFEEIARPPIAQIQAVLETLAAEYSSRGIEIKETAAGFRIQVRPELANEISRLWPERPARYSRALLETLALIAYRQPITRAEIEAVRGVSVNPNILKTVIERNWVRVVGHRDVPGRPELLGTTRDFLEYFGLRSLDELPPLAELKALGEIKVQFDLPDAGPVAVLGTGAGGADGERGESGAGAGESGAAGALEAGASEELIAGAGNESVTRDSVGSAGAGESGAGGADDAADERYAAGEVTVAREAATGDRGATVEGATARGRATAGDRAAAKHQTPEGDHSAESEAEKFAATIDAELAGGDDDAADDDELSAADPGSTELIAGPRDLDD